MEFKLLDGGDDGKYNGTGLLEISGISVPHDDFVYGGGIIWQRYSVYLSLIQLMAMWRHKNTRHLVWAIRAIANAQLILNRQQTRVGWTLGRCWPAWARYPTDTKCFFPSNRIQSLARHHLWIHWFVGRVVSEAKSIRNLQRPCYRVKERWDQTESVWL